MKATLTNEGRLALQSAVDECLTDVAGLAARWAAGLTSITSYQEGLVGIDKVTEDCRLVFIRLLSDIGDKPIPPEARGISERVGHNRALEGVPLADLMAAVRMDYRIMWEAISDTLEESDVVAVFAGVPRIWEAVERHSQEVTAAYMATQYGMAQVRQDERRLWFARLLENDGRNHMLNQRACRVLSFTPDAHYTVLVPADRADVSLERIATALTRHGYSLHLQDTEDGPVIVLQEKHGQMLSLPPSAPTIRLICLKAVHGISLVPAAIRLAHGLRPALHEDDRDVIPLSDYWSHCVFQNPVDAGFLIHSRYMEQVDALPTPERRTLLHTAETYLASGSLSKVAEELYCHRNTITNRLDQLGRLTALDLRVPAEAALFVLARSVALTRLR
jgi:hypothetical protein